MPYSKTMLCLASSWRPQGRCVACKEMNDHGQFVGWVRPTNPQNHNAISEYDLTYEDGTHALVLDEVRVKFTAAVPHGHQTENHAIDANIYWAKQGRANWAKIVAATDVMPGALWVNGHNSQNGTNDKVPVPFLAGIHNSLALINPNNLVLNVGTENAFGGGQKRRIRGAFSYNQHDYEFVVTDPWISAHYLPQPDGAYPIPHSRICVSLSEPLGDSAIKLIASIITPQRAV